MAKFLDELRRSYATFADSYHAYSQMNLEIPFDQVPPLFQMHEEESPNDFEAGTFLNIMPICIRK